MDSRQVSFEALSLMLEEYEQLKHRFSKLVTDCWALFEVKETSDGYKFFHTRDAATEQELIDYVERCEGLLYYADNNTYFIAPVKKNALGQITSGNYNLTDPFKYFKGDCKMLLRKEIYPDNVKKNPKSREWIQIDTIYADEEAKSS